MTFYPGSIEEADTQTTVQPPSQLHPHFLHGFERQYVHGPQFSILKQFLNLPGCTCRHFRFDCRAMMRLFAFSHAPCYGCCHVLSGELCWNTASGKQRLFPGQCAWLYVPDGIRFPVDMEAGTTNLWMVCWTPAFLSERGLFTELLATVGDAPRQLQVLKMPLSYRWEHVLAELNQLPEPGLVLERRMLEALQVYQQVLAHPVDTLVAKVNAIRQLLDNHLSEHTTIAQLARRVQLSEVALKKAFREAVGQPIYQYLVERRMLWAMQELQQTDRTIREIARACGYMTASHFTVRFRRRFGMVPQDVRKLRE